ncbi:AzlC family ABC transporter permease [Testudinibacter sp. TR-2022]|uniref:AzlC family ABC transporter permease n=1 Tax=Testudinibacter sp. TR-2022 TaxID=2585029 RepID=UPI00111B8F09|nr:AzlC family ABC transporter permease [Testudinibacter sp. TR-2022]TNH06454.1 AzlC family ABC transporter permease [Pasteurellaceae bacterium Phil11]TNH24803.1 AzlC family ABC transporter permease [Testudinibacter sp. TR-2022]TNH29242.1 AzlC family ABC transporter permease [Testudinibacter sp. TR-2022]
MNSTANKHTIPSASNTWGSLIKLTLPIAMGYYAAGIAYGILGVGAGLPIWLVVLLSIVVYSGAAQYAAIPLFASAAGFLPLVLGTLLISLRQLFYTLALHTDLPQKGWQRWYSTASITDESYALATTQEQHQRQNNITKINFLCQFYWVSASLIGALLGAELADAIPHLAFALPCLFIILAYEQYRQNRHLFPLLLALSAFIACKLLAPGWVMLAAILCCILVILIRYHLQLGKTLSKENIR